MLYEILADQPTDFPEFFKATICVFFFSRVFESPKYHMPTVRGKDPFDVEFCLVFGTLNITSSFDNYNLNFTLKAVKKSV